MCEITNKRKEHKKRCSFFHLFLYNFLRCEDFFTKECYRTNADNRREKRNKCSYLKYVNDVNATLDSTEEGWMEKWTVR